MLLVIDVGNTNTVFALYDDRQCVHVWRCSSDAGRTADEYRSWLYQLFAESGLDFRDVERVVVASVVPDANFNIRRLCQQAFGCEGAIAGEDRLNYGIEIAIDEPEEAGADRLINALAVTHDHQLPAIVIDFGTATTFDVVGEGGVYRGGAIAPGVRLAVRALQDAAAQLPTLQIAPASAAIGTSTRGAMQSGVYWGYAGLIEGMITRIEEELGHSAFVVATGGLADLYAGAVPRIDCVDSALTLNGLYYLAEINT
mgnify:CR=1 FL=1